MDAVLSIGAIEGTSILAGFGADQTIELGMEGASMAHSLKEGDTIIITPEGCEVQKLVVSQKVYNFDDGAIDLFLDELK